MDCSSSLARSLRRDNDPGEAPSVVPLTAADVSKLRLASYSRFDSSSLKQHVAENGDFCWRIQGANEYVVGGQWRRRPEIAHLLEMTQGRNREALVSRLLASFRRSGVQVVVVACEDFSLFVSFFAKLDFEKLDEIIEMERHFGDALASAPIVPIRAYTPEDSRVVVEVDNRSFPWLWQNSHDELFWYSSLPGVEMYVAQNPEGALVGYVGMTVHGANGHLDRLAVHPDVQRRGYGAALLSFAIRRMEQRHARRIALSTQTHNSKSQSLYRKFGFHFTFRSQSVFGLRLGQT